MSKYGKTKHIIIADERITCRFPPTLWKTIERTAKKRKIKNITEFIKLELYNEFNIDPPDEGVLLRKIKKNAPMPDLKRTKVNPPKPMLSSVIVNTLKERL